MFPNIYRNTVPIAGRGHWKLFVLYHAFILRRRIELLGNEDVLPRRVARLDLVLISNFVGTYMRERILAAIYANMYLK